jgi:hypothetical protein
MSSNQSRLDGTPRDVIAVRVDSRGRLRNTTVGTMDLDAILKAAGQVETLLGIGAETLFEPKKKLGLEAESDRTGRSDPLHFPSRHA